MDELTLHPDPRAPVPRPARRLRGYAEPHLGPAPIPASDPAIVGSSPRIYAQRVDGGVRYELARGRADAPKFVAREQVLMGAQWRVWAEYRSRRMILPR